MIADAVPGSAARGRRQMCALFDPAPDCLTATVTTTRIYIEEWHFGDERWVFDVGARLRVRCGVVDSELLAAWLQLWDEQTLHGVRYTVGDVTGEDPVLVEGVITSILALECRYPAPAGGRAIPHSGTAHQVRQARGWTGEVDFSRGVVAAFLIDVQLDTEII
jgi:hypothetical protein